MSQIIHTHGGLRVGAGRKKDTGPYAESTKVVRIPHSRVKVVKNFLLHQITSNVESFIMPAEQTRVNPITLFSHKVPAGFPSPADDHAEKRLDLNEYLIDQSESTFFVRIKGDSMIDAGISDGDTVIIKKTNVAENGKIVVALIDNHEATLKRYRKKSNAIALESANPAYETRIFGPDRIKIQGVLTSLYRNF